MVVIYVGNILFLIRNYFCWVQNLLQLILYQKFSIKLAAKAGWERTNVLSPLLFDGELSAQFEFSLIV